MSKIALAALLSLALALPLCAQGVKVTRTDGRVVQGELLGYEHGRYRIRLANGTVEEIEEAKVQDIVLTGKALPEKSASADSAAAEAARAAFERGDFELALQKLGQALKDLDDERGRLQDLAGRISQAYVEGLLEKRDAARLHDGLRRVLPTLSPDARRALLTRLAERCADLHRSAPDAAFTAAFCERVAALAEEGAFPKESRAGLADLFAERAKAEAEKNRLGAALSLYQGAVKFDPTRLEKLRATIVETAVALGGRLLEANDGPAAVQAAREALALDPAHAGAKQILDEAEFLALKQDVDIDFGGEGSLQALRNFLARNPPAERKAWAEQTLAKLTAQNDPRLPGLSAQLRKYFPVKVGRTLLYRRGEGDIREKIRVDAVVREDDVIRVYHTLKEIYREYATTKVYLVEIERDAVVMPTGVDREPLLKFPLRAGDTWTWQARNREFRRTVKSLGETVTVGPETNRKTYTDCLVVDFTSTVDREGTPVSITSRSTYAPAIGLVRLEFLDAEFRKFNLELLEIGME